MIFYKNDIKKFFYIKEQSTKITNDSKIDFKKQILEKSNKDLLNFINVPKKNNNIPDDTIYNDVISRQTKPFGDEAGRHINVHETAHGIHSDLRNEYERILGYKCNVFYCLKGRAVIIKDPPITISEVCGYIPKNLRSYRYDLYFKEQLKYWDDVPTYIFDEWTAYILGSECAIEDYELGIAHTKSDAVSGCLDFSIYSIAFARAVKEEDSEYWNRHPEFKEFVKYNLKRAEMAFNKGKNIFKSEKQIRLLDSFINNPDSKELKKFMIEEFGEYFINININEN